jgi:hypothetical protein
MKIKLIYQSSWNNFESDDPKEVFENDIKFLQGEGSRIEGDPIRTYIPKDYKNFKGKADYSSLWQIIIEVGDYLFLSNGKTTRFEKVKSFITNNYNLDNAFQMQNEKFYNLFVTNKKLCKELSLKIIEEQRNAKNN